MITHAELKGVTPETLAWWYRHVIGEVEYAGRQWPRYLVWHPLDHMPQLYRAEMAAIETLSSC